MKTDGMALVQYFEGNSFVGSRKMYCCGASSSGVSFSAYWPHTAYVCPVCGELWGRAVMCYEFDYAPRVHEFWAIEKRRCVEHGDGQFLYDGINSDSVWLDYADAGLLTRELLALLEGLNHECNRNFPA